MFNIKTLFNKTRSKQTGFFILYSSIKRAVDENTKGDLPIQAISLKKGSDTIRIVNIDASFRTQIFLKKKKILEDVNRSQDTLKFTDIT